VRWIRKTRALARSASTDAKRRLGPAWAGFLQGIGCIAVLAAALAYLSNRFSLATPSPELFAGLAQAGVGLFVAFSVTIASVKARTGDEDEHVSWLAFGCGSALAGLVGIGISLALAAANPTAISVPLRLAGLSWAATSLAVLGIVISLGPLMIFRSHQASRLAADGDAN
jgi:hypothetical protein